MLKKRVVFLVTCVALLQIGYRSQILTISSKPVLDATDHAIFLKEFESLTMLVGLLLLLAVMFLAQQPGLIHSKPSNKYWMAGFLAILVVSSVMVVYTNPQGRFPWNRRKAYIAIQARSIKPDLYKKIEHTPDLILFGSSISFTTPSNYFRERWNLEAFNMALNGGGPVDFVNILNFVDQKSPDGKFPSVVMVELASPSLRVSAPALSPVDFIPYMFSVGDQLAALGQTMDHLIQAPAFADSIFTLTIVDQSRWKFPILFNKDGTGLRTVGELADEEYSNIVENAVPIGNYLLSCNKLDPSGMGAIEQLVKLSHQHQFSLVFYITPFNDEFFSVSTIKPSQYSHCKKLLNNYMQNLIKQNPNVFFRDLSVAPEISSGGKDVYLDTHHLTAKGSVLVLDALYQEIESAIVWARENR